jgi:hypothetical protein
VAFNGARVVSTAVASLCILKLSSVYPLERATLFVAIPDRTNFTPPTRRETINTKKGGNMYATVRRYEGVTNPSEAAQRVNEGFLSLISQVPGFVAYYWVDAGGGVMISTSVFQDQAGAAESNRRAADYVLQNMVSLLPHPPQITAGEVVAYKAT